jgi:hypothetical protein
MTCQLWRKKTKLELGTFLKRLCYKDLKTVKTLKIRLSSAKIWCLKSEKSAILLLKIDFFGTLNRHIFALPCCIFNIFTVLRSL